MAERDLGESFGDSRPVTFTYFEITENEDELPGRPPYYFEKKSSNRSRNSYCDVGEAFAKELGVIMPIVPAP